MLMGIHWQLFRYRFASYNNGMSYDVGQHIDLSHVNRKKSSGGDLAAPKSSGHYFLVGTQFIFDFVDGHITARRRIPVAFA